MLGIDDGVRVVEAFNFTACMNLIRITLLGPEYVLISTGLGTH